MVQGGVETDRVAALPDLHNLEGWLIFERNYAEGVIPDTRFGDNTIHGPTAPLEGSQRSFAHGCSLTGDHSFLRYIGSDRLVRDSK